MAAPRFPADGRTARWVAGEPGVWFTRIAWVAVPLFVGPVLGPALADSPGSVPRVATVAAWALWATGLLAALVPLPLSLTALRTVAPGAPVLAVWAAIAAPSDVSPLGSAVALITSGVATAAAFSPLTGDAFVDGSSYGDERRLALRCPVPLGALAAVTWCALAAGVVAGPLLLAARQWLLGTLAVVVGCVVAVAAFRALHGLARRWVVFVPAGVVIHDPVNRPDAVMVTRRAVFSLAPARAGSTALDLTPGAAGLALELRAVEPLPVTVRSGRSLETIETDAVLFTPTRPGAVLAEAAARRFPVG